MADIFLTIGSLLKWIGIVAVPVLILPLCVLIAPLRFSELGKRLSAAIDKMTGGVLSLAIASALLLIFSQLLVVILRYVFGMSFTWLNEIGMYAFAAMFMLGSAAALRDDGHVRVDILRPRFGESGRSWIELAGIYLFLFPICIRLLMMSEQGLARSWALLEGSRETDGLPLLFLFKTLVPVFAILMIMQGLSEALKAALRLTGQDHTSNNSDKPRGSHGN